MSKERKGFKVPHVYVILLTIAAVCALLTYVIPAGVYELHESASGRMVVNPDSFQYVENTPVGLLEFVRAVPDGMVETASIIFFILMIGGAFSVVEATGAIEAGIGKLTAKANGKEKLFIPIIVIVFSLGGAIFGMAEETLVFIPIMVSLAIALGFDSLTGIGMVLAGAGAGFTGAFMNPFTVGVAQGIAELPLFSGMQFRIVSYVVMVSLVITFLYRYAGKIKANPTLSPVYDIDQDREEVMELHALPELDNKRRMVLFTLLGTIILLVYGVVQKGWYIQEIAGLFFGMAIVVALVGRLGANGFAESLIKGFANLAGGALVVGFARAILVILTNGQIIDTILHASSEALLTLPSSVSAVSMYVFQCLLNFIVPSGSGQAALSIPILAPLSDLVGVTRQTAVLAYQFGDGISNIFTPTSGYFMAGLALAKIPWQKWAKWILPLILLEYLAAGILVFIAHAINYGPF